MTLIERLEALRVAAQKAAIATADPTERAYCQGIADGLRNAILVAEGGPDDRR